MRLTEILSAFAIASLAQGFVIPREATNGVYAVSIAEDGSEIHTKLADRDAANAVERDNNSANLNAAVLDTLEKREANRIHCGCGFNMNPGNTDAAVADLKRQFGGFSQLAPYMSYYSIRGSGNQRVVAFSCSRSPRNWTLYSDHLARDLSAITNACGRYIAGAIQSGPDSEALFQGYQRYADGDDFCAAATSSRAQKC